MDCPVEKCHNQIELECCEQNSHYYIFIGFDAVENSLAFSFCLSMTVVLSNVSKCIMSH